MAAGLSVEKIQAKHSTSRSVSDEESLSDVFTRVKKNCAKRKENLLEHLETARLEARLKKEEEDKLSLSKGRIGHTMRLKEMGQTETQIKVAKVQIAKQQHAYNFQAMEARRAAERKHIQLTRQMDKRRNHFLKKCRAAETEVEAIMRAKDALLLSSQKEREKIESDFRKHRSVVQGKLYALVCWYKSYANEEVMELNRMFAVARTKNVQELHQKRQETLTKIRQGIISKRQADQEWYDARQEARRAGQEDEKTFQKKCREVEVNFWKLQWDAKLNAEKDLHEADLKLEIELKALEVWYQTEVSLVNEEMEKWMAILAKQERIHAMESNNIRRLQVQQDSALTSDIFDQQQYALKKILNNLGNLRDQLKVQGKKTRRHLKGVLDCVAKKAADIQKAEETRRMEEWMLAEAKREEHREARLKQDKEMRSITMKRNEERRSAVKRRNEERMLAVQMKREEALRTAKTKYEKNRAAILKTQEQQRAANKKLNEERRIAIKQHNENQCHQEPPKRKRRGAVRLRN